MTPVLCLVCKRFYVERRSVHVFYFILFDKYSHCVNGDDLHYQYDSTLLRNNLDHKHTNNSGKLLLNIIM